MRIAALLLILAAMCAHAETYRWVDEKGRVNYSNTPPPSAGKAKQVRAVEDRVSTYQTDPAYEQYLRQRAAQITAAQEAAWLERQRQLAAAQAAYPPDYYQSSYSSYPDYYYSGYVYPVAYAVAGARRNQVMHHTGSSRAHVSHHGASRGGRR
jgi:hypothetical protein